MNKDWNKNVFVRELFQSPEHAQNLTGQGPHRHLFRLFRYFKYSLHEMYCSCKRPHVSVYYMNVGQNFGTLEQKCLKPSRTNGFRCSEVLNAVPKLWNNVSSKTKFAVFLARFAKFVGVI